MRRQCSGAVRRRKRLFAASMQISGIVLRARRTRYWTFGLCAFPTRGRVVVAIMVLIESIVFDHASIVMLSSLNRPVFHVEHPRTLHQARNLGLE